MSEEVKKFTIKKGIKTGNDQIDQYIEELHEYILNFETSNIKKLILSLDKLAGVIAEDIDMIINGTDWEEDPLNMASDEDEEDVFINTGRSRLKVLSDSKDSKVYDRIMSLLQRVKDFELVSKAAKGLLPDVEEYVEKTDQEELIKDIKLKGKGNSFEEMQDKHFKKRSGSEII